MATAPASVIRRHLIAGSSFAALAVPLPIRAQTTGNGYSNQPCNQGNQSGTPGYNAISCGTGTTAGAAIGAVDSRVAGVATRVNTRGAQVTALQSSVARLSRSVSSLNDRVNQLSSYSTAARTEARYGVAAAMAMTTAPLPSEPGRTSWTFNLATFHGRQAMGASLAHRLPTRVPLAITGGVSYSADTTAGRIGLAGEV